MRAAREATGAAGGPDGPEVVSSVMPGIVRSVSVEPGQTVEKGQPLLILEAMKMQNEIRAPRDAVVEKVHVGADTVVAKGDALVTLGPAD
jgi:glutaconyl-CoA decarboxylase